MVQYTVAVIIIFSGGPMKKKLLLTVAALSFVSTVAKAELFSIEMLQGALHETRQFDSIVDIFDHYKKGNLDAIFATYNKNAASFSKINFRGIPMELSFDNSAVLTFNAPTLGIAGLEFDGKRNSQEASFNLFRDYLKKNQNDLMKKILKSGIEKTPYDAVAGNPNSMMATMTDISYQRAGGGVLGNFVSYISPDASRHHFKHNGESVTATVYTLPLAKSFELSGGSKIMFDMPISYTNIDDSKAYSAQLGLAWAVPVVNNDKFRWIITPGVRSGVTGSKDMLSGGILYSGSLASHIEVPVNNWTFGMTNMIGYIKDVSLDVAGYEIDYELHNTVFKNGISARYDFSDDWALGTSYDYTFYEGSELFIDDYHDVNVSLIRKLDPKSFITGVALVGNYSFDDDDYYAYRLGVSFLF